MSAAHDFPRTTCACAECVKCCHRQPGPLAGGDFERIAKHVELSNDGMTSDDAIEFVKENLCASPGALIAQGGVVKRVGSIVPKRRKGKCVFLDEHDRCSIHEVAPFGCSHFDTHMSRSMAQPRSEWLVRSQMEPEYQALRNQLEYAQSYKPVAY